MRVLIEAITPSKARALLDLNTGNFRPINKKRVARYANDMRDGHWELNGETVKLNGPILLDGQHRLLAIILSGVTVKTAVAYDVDVDGMHIDEGFTRKTGDYLRHMGMANGCALAAVAKLIIAHQRQQWNWNEPSNVNVGRNELLAMCQRHQDKLQQAIRVSGKIKTHRLSIRHSCLGTIIYLGSADNAAESSATARWFVSKLWDGSELAKHNAVYHLRERAIVSASSQARRWSTEYERAMVTLAWNKTVLGVEIKQLKIAATGPTAANIPYVINEQDAV